MASLLEVVKNGLVVEESVPTLGQFRNGHCKLGSCFLDEAVRGRERASRAGWTAA